MWIVRAGDDLYLRSSYGPNNPWFRRAKAGGAGRIRAGDLERDVTFSEAAPGVHAAIDAAYHAKYDRYGPRVVGAAPVRLSRSKCRTTTSRSRSYSWRRSCSQP